MLLAALLLDTVIVAAVGVVLLIGPRAAAGSPVAAERIDVGVGGGVQIKDATVGSPARPDSDPAVAAVLTELNTYWTAILPAEFGRVMTPLAGGYQAVDSSAAVLVGGSALCITSPDQIAGNAYYCPTEDGIVYDSAALIPVLLGHYGSAGLVTAFAHEFGHAIQARIGPTPADRAAHPADYPNIVIEAQGDCYAGAFLNWVTEQAPGAGRPQLVHLPRSALVRAFAPLLDFADPVSTRVDDPVAHGLALDRLSAVLVGVRSGPKACHALVRSSIDPTLGRSGLAPPSGTPRFATEDAVLAAARSQVAVFASALPAGAGAPSALAGAAPSAENLRSAKPFGQFAVAATQALAVGQRLTGTPDGAACFTGSWTAAVFGHAAAGALGGWAGDADEALNMLRSRPGATVEELSGFVDGFTGGWAACH